MTRSLFLLALLLFARGAAGAEAAPVGAPKDAPARGALEFWPKRVNPDATHLLYVQLSRPEAEPRVRLECGTVQRELDPPTWSHPEHLLHAFDLEWTVPRVRERCRVVAVGARQREYEARHSLVVRPRAHGATAALVAPWSTAQDSEVTVEVEGRGLSEVVTVYFVAAGRFRHLERSARPVVRGDAGVVFVPFAAGLHDAPPGEYLVVVENEDRTGAVADGTFTVIPAAAPEIEATRVEQRDGVLVLTVAGFALSTVEDALLQLPAGSLPLGVRHDEGGAVPTLSVVLPPYMDERLAIVSNLSIQAGRLVIHAAAARAERVPSAAEEATASGR